MDNERKNIYTEFQREKAINLYIIRTAPVIRELGYPDGHFLKRYDKFVPINKKLLFFIQEVLNILKLKEKK
ncbi:hypothetical protein [Thomasclavelia spiroformis]|uniref:hypothetical protein n=1 Tax=Thomasclavelia spiroformis TaxID=29348 RepID=UPI00255B9F1B|nr:hypothetical protein [Thomasclavelia spiroformis]